MPQISYVRWVPSPPTLRVIDKVHTFLYRASRGLIGSRMDGLDVLLLSTVGQKTGKVRRVPLPYFRSGSKYLLIGSYGGNPKNPHWVNNLIKNPRVEVQVGSRSWSTLARVAQGEEREQLWKQLTYDFPRYANYQKKTTRQIPVVVLEPAGSA